jgi:hypothetical protein
LTVSTCRVTCSDGHAFDVQGDLEAVTDELHKVATRREHTFAFLRDPGGTAIAVRPEAVLRVQPVGLPGEPSSA